MSEQQTGSEVIVSDIATHVPGEYKGRDLNLMHSMWPDMRPSDFQVFLRVCIARQLNPMTGDIFPIIYSKNDPAKRKMVLIESIDSMRKRGHASKLIVDMKGPQFCGVDGEWTDVWTEDVPPFAARFAMQAAHMKRLVWHTRLWSEVAKDPTTKAGEFWKSQPTNMLGIAAERHAWRKTVPAIMGGMYGQEEMPSGHTVSVELDRLDVPNYDSIAPPDDDEPDVIEHEAPPPTDEADPGWDAATGPPGGEPFDVDNVIRALWPRMRDSTPPWGWEHLEAITGWPPGADREAGIRVLLTDAIGSEDELASMVFSALEATRS